MLPPIDLEALPALARKVLGPGGPAQMRMLAAKGVIPGLKPGDVVTVVAALVDAEDAKVAESARATLAALPSPVRAAVLLADLPALVIDRLSEQCPNQHDLIESVLRMPRIASETLERMAAQADEKAGELLATNEQLMLANPRVIELLYMNKRVRMSTADRLLELAVRNDVTLDIPAFKEAATAIRDELVAEASEQLTFDDVLFIETEKVAQAVRLQGEDDDTHDVDDEGEERVKDRFLPLHTQIAQLTASQKIRRAQLGTPAERLLLVRDPNRLVACAVVRSPLMRENEAVRISASRSVTEDVLRIIALNRDFTRSYQVKLNLVSNPRTPLSFAARLIPHLRESDLRSLSKSKNVPGAISQAVKQQLERKTGATRS
jgi:hypothetical protein